MELSQSWWALRSDESVLVEGLVSLLLSLCSSLKSMRDVFGGNI